MQNKATPWRGFILPWRRIPYRVSQHVNEDVAGLDPAVVITGGSAGIGLALARRFIENGHKTAIVARNAIRLDEAAADLKASAGGDLTTILCDVSEPNAFEIITAALHRSGLYLDVLVNNAGTGLAGPFVNQSEADLSKLIALNIEAVTRLTREALPPMIARGHGGILNVASLGGSVPGPNQAAYYASKAYVVSLTEAIASETSGSGVTVSALLPGPVNTSFHEEMGAEQSLYRFMLPPMLPDAVARSAYRWFKFGNRVIVPGLANVFFFAALRVLPHAITVPMMYWLLRRSDT